MGYMRSAREIVERPSDALHEAYEDAYDALERSARYAARRPSGVVKVLLVVLAIVGFVYVSPELHRETRIMRM